MRYKHFNPEEHEIESKIATVKSGIHCKFNINYHFVWIPKYRKHILRGKIVDVLKDILQGVCKDNSCELLALEVMPDHIHLFVGAKPTHSPATLVKLFKGNTSIQLRRCFPELKHLGWQTKKKYTNLWARGYYVGTAGHVSQEQIKRYILEQSGKDVFNYSVYGAKNKKIGNFVQTKLERNNL